MTKLGWRGKTLDLRAAAFFVRTALKSAIAGDWRENEDQILCDGCRRKPEGVVRVKTLRMPRDMVFDIRKAHRELSALPLLTHFCVIFSIVI